MKNMKKIVALLVAVLMIVASMSVAFAGDPTYKITVTNSNSDHVSMNGQNYTAWRLFDLSYVDDPAVTTDTTPYGIDKTPHAYYLSTSSPFYKGSWNADHTVFTATADSASAVILQYFTFTYLPGDTTKVLVKPITTKNEQGEDVSIFTAAKAYEMAQKMNKFLTDSVPDGYKTTVTADNEGCEITVPSAGYYLVTGGGYAYKLDDEGNKAVDSTKAVTAAVALTSTDPTASIVAKMDAPDIDKAIDRDVEKEWDNDVKFSTDRPGDKVPFIVKGTVPNMTGFEDNYYYIVTDTMSKGLTFQNDVAVKIEDTPDVNVPRKDAVDSSSKDLYYVVEYSYDGTSFTTLASGAKLSAKPEGAETTFRLVFYNMLSLKGELITAENVAEKANNDQSKIGTYTNKYVNKDIIITYKGEINGEAVIGVAGNPNKVKLTYSNNPNDEGEGEGKPNDEEWSEVTGETPDHWTNTFVTGLQLYKYEDATKKNPLAGAKFELTGTGLKDIKENTTEVFVADKDGTYFLLADGNFTTKVPSTDSYDETSHVYTHGTSGAYKTVASDSTKANAVTVDGINGFKFLKYAKKTIKSFEKTNSGTAKITATTGDDGVLTFTGLKEGNYTLTEIEAPTGYNLLDKPIYIKIAYADPTANAAVPGTGSCTWTATVYEDAGFTTAMKKGGTGTDQNDSVTLSLTDANLFLEEVENQTGVELPSTGGIGTTLFYIGGSILVLAAVILLITKRRMSAND